MVDNVDSNQLSSDTDSDEDTEQSLIDYFSRGFQYKSIVDFLKKKHGIVISKRTLRNPLNEYGLRRRSLSFDINDVRRAMHELLNGPGNMEGTAPCGMPFERKGYKFRDVWFNN